MVSQGMIVFLMGLVVIFGALNTIANKILNHTDALSLRFHHSWFIVFLMFFGEALSIFVYLCIRKNVEQEEQEEEENRGKEKISLFQLSVPALCDLGQTILMTLGLTMMAGSVFQMFRGSVIIFTCLLSVFYLKNKHYIFHFIGLTFVVCGLILVGVASYITNTKEAALTSIWGIILVILSQLFTALQFIYEEYLIKKYICHPIKAIAWEGIWGCGFTVILLIIFQFIECPNGSTSKSVQKICTKDDKGKWTVENTYFAFKQLGDSYLLIGMALLFVLSISVFNIAGITISKHMTGTARAVIDSVATVVVWGFFLMGFLPNNVREKFSWIQLIGFVLLVFGTLIYNEVKGLAFNLFDKDDDINSIEQLQEHTTEEDKSLKEKISDSDKPTDDTSKEKDISEEEQILLNRDN